MHVSCSARRCARISAVLGSGTQWLQRNAHLYRQDTGYGNAIMKSWKSISLSHYDSHYTCDCHMWFQFRTTLWKWRCKWPRSITGTLCSVEDRWELHRRMSFCLSTSMSLIRYLYSFTFLSTNTFLTHLWVICSVFSNQSLRLWLFGLSPLIPSLFATPHLCVHFIPSDLPAALLHFIKPTCVYSSAEATFT
jgi:hypothetical protein